MAAKAAGSLQTRQRILSLIREFPGLHLREVARQLDTSVALVEYHTPFLQRSGLIRIQVEDGYQRLFPVGTGSVDMGDRARRRLATLRQPFPLNITLWMLDVGGPVRHGDLVEGLGMGKSKVSFHLKKLMEGGIVTKTSDGSFDLVDRPAVAELLLTHQPIKDLRDRFASLWASLYDR